MLFDGVGTLFELREPVGATYARVARDFGVELPASRLDEAFGRVFASMPPLAHEPAANAAIAARERAWWHEIVRRTLRAADSTVRIVDFDAFFARIFRIYGEASTWRCLPGARDLLQRLQETGFRTGMVSNFDTRLRGLLEALELAPLLDTLVLPADAGAAKPDPRPFLMAVARIGIEPEQVVYVGDDPGNDLDGARNAGLHPLDVRSLATLSALPERLRRLDDEGLRARDEEDR